MSTEGTISSLRAGDDVRGVYACVRKDRLKTRTGSPYLALELRDRTGSVQARAFRDADVLGGRFERGDLVSVVGKVERFRDDLTIEVTGIRRVEPAGVRRDEVTTGAGEDATVMLPGSADRSAGPATVAGAGAANHPALTQVNAGPGAPDPQETVVLEDFLPTTYRDMEELDGFLEHLASEVYDPGFKLLLETMLADERLRVGFRRTPCSRNGHHAYLGGLLEHTVAVATLAREMSELHVKLNSDLLITAAIVHDIGLIREFTYGAEIGLSDEGRMLGHLALGQQMLLEWFARLEALRAGVVLDEPRKLALLHCVLSHHGAASLPGGRFSSAEALTLYRINSLDAGVKGALEHGLGASEN